MNRIVMTFELNDRRCEVSLDNCPDPEKTFKSVIKWNNVLSDQIEWNLLQREPQTSGN